MTPVGTWTVRSLVAGLLLLVAATTRAENAAPDPAFPIRFGGPFELVDHHGATRTDRDFRGHFLLIQFGYTYCPDVCPLGLDTITAALDLLDGAATNVQPLFISVDPARDTPETLAAYLAHFHPSLLGLTGTEPQIQAVARAYKVHRRKVVPTASDASDYLVDHASITYLMGPDGAFVTLFPYGSTPTFIAAAIRTYVN